jgi:hypothetical protein
METHAATGYKNTSNSTTSLTLPSRRMSADVSTLEPGTMSGATPLGFKVAEYESNPG